MALQEELESQGNWLFRYRSLLPLAILPIGILAQVLVIRTSAWSFLAILPYWPVYESLCLAVSLLGAFVRIYTVGYTPVGTSGRNTARQVADSLNTTGIYSVVRHPLYLGNFLMWLGIAMLTCSVGFVAAFIPVYWLYYERIMYAEEQYLNRKFGHIYQEWARQTPAIVPRISQFVPSRLHFFWKKAVKKEKNGVFALFLLFSLFDGLTAWQVKAITVNYVLIVMALATGLAYVVLKYLKKYTTLLDEQGR